MHAVSSFEDVSQSLTAESPESLLEQIGARVREAPDALAAADGARSLTYEQLDARANRIAHELRAAGAEREALVALCAPRSLEFVVGALAILKSGAAYLPLDPQDPLERRAAILHDAGAQVLLCAAGLEAGMSDGAPRTIALRLNGPRWPAPPPATLAPSNLAYVIYTSGSTGTPKGVEIEHRSLSNLVHWHLEAFALRPRTRISQLASVGFDAAGWEIWPALACGASLHIPDEHVRVDPVALRNWLLVERIEVAFAPTPLAERLIALPWPREPRLRLLLTGGDVLHVAPPLSLPFTLVNNYGPTEATVVSTSGRVSVAGYGEGRPSIGRAIDGIALHVLSEDGAEVAKGMPGELFIGGAGVARGYRNRPALTEERFVPDRFSDEPSARLYRTGDRVRALPNGSLAFLGRCDEQVKIRGVRIEPAEVVAALRQQQGVAGCAVCTREMPAGERQLVAYLELGDARPTPGKLRAALREKLPDAMVPSLFVAVGALPLTAHGKVDLRALPPPDARNLLRDPAAESPRTSAEARIAGLVAPLLGLPDVNVHDDFFQLGGHSLMGTQLIGRLREVFGVELSLRTIFEAPTIAQLALEVERRLSEQLDSMTDQEAQAAEERARAAGPLP